MLATLCLGISIATLMQVLALAAGTRQQMLEILADTGNRNLTINAGTVTALPNRGSGISMATTLRMADYQAIANLDLPLARMAPLISGTLPVRFRELDMAAAVTGTTPEYLRLRRLTLAQGRLPDALDDARLAKVAVVGAQVADMLFSADQEQVVVPGQALGQTILIGTLPFEVVGVLRARGSGQTGIAQDDAIYIPLNTALSKVFNASWLNSIVVEAVDLDALAGLRNRVTDQLRLSHALDAREEDDFTILDASQALAAANRGQQFAMIFFQGFALLTLAMAGAGIFAVNWLNVKERDSEFGLRKAVGATATGIAALVLGETLLLGLAGGVGGLLLGLLVMQGLALLTSWALLADAMVFGQTFAAALAVSVFAALLPAWFAATRQPLAALGRL